MGVDDTDIESSSNHDGIMWQTSPRNGKNVSAFILKKFYLLDKRFFTPTIDGGVPIYFWRKKYMGHVKDNLLTKGFSGRIGGEIVFRQVNGRTIFCKRPRKRETFTTKQEVQQTRFQKAVLYARTVLIHPVMREDYTRAAKQATIRSAYLAAVTDFLLEPEIASVHTQSYKGHAGDSIVVLAIDDFKIIKTVVTIKRADGSVLETGEATRSEFGWIYTTQQENTTLTGIRIIITVKDRLDKTAITEVVL